MSALINKSPYRFPAAFQCHDWFIQSERPWLHHGGINQGPQVFRVCIVHPVVNGSTQFFNSMCLCLAKLLQQTLSPLARQWYKDPKRTQELSPTHHMVLPKGPRECCFLTCTQLSRLRSEMGERQSPHPPGEVRLPAVCQRAESSLVQSLLITPRCSALHAVSRNFMRSLAREDQGSLPKSPCFSQTMFRTSIGKRDLFSREGVLRLLSTREVKVRQKVIASTQHFPFAQTKIKDGVKSGPKKSRGELCAISCIERQISQQVRSQMALLASKIKSGDRASNPNI